MLQLHVVSSHSTSKYEKAAITITGDKLSDRTYTTAEGMLRLTNLVVKLATVKTPRTMSTPNTRLPQVFLHDLSRLPQFTALEIISSDIACFSIGRVAYAYAP